MVMRPADQKDIKGREQHEEMHFRYRLNRKDETDFVMHSDSVHTSH